MPRLTVSTPKYRKHASGQAVVTIAGKDHYLGPWKTKASLIEYDRLVGEWLAAGRPSSPAASPHEITASEVVAKFWTFAKSHYVKHGRSTGTAENYKPALTLLRKRYGHTPAAEFGPLALKAIRLAMIEEGQSRRYVNDNVARIKRLFKWAASEQLVPASVAQALMTVEGLRKGHGKARETAPVEPVDDAVVEATLPYLPAVVADLVRLQRLTGCRPGEILAMRPADVDRSSDVWRYTPAEHKTEHHGKRRVIFIGPQAQAVLLPYLLRDAEAYCFSPADSERKRLAERHAKRTTPLNCGTVPSARKRRRVGKRYIIDQYRRAIARACVAAFAPPELRKGPKGETLELRQVRLQKLADWRAKHVWSPHQLRHSRATEIRRQYGLEAAQVTLGHSRMNVTEIYAEKNQDLAAQVAREVG
jgi:integrase